MQGEKSKTAREERRMEEATMAEDAKPPPPRPERRRRQFISVRQRLVNKRALQAEKASVPDPWLSRKFAVGIVLAIYCWSYYVVVGRVCTPGLRGEPGRKFGKGAAAAILVLESILWLMFTWSYLRMILTGPGFARDHVPQTDPPLESEPASLDKPSSGGADSDFTAGPPYQALESSDVVEREGKPKEDVAHVEHEDGAEPVERGPYQDPDVERGPTSAEPPIPDADVAAEEHPKAGAFGPPIASTLASLTQPTPPPVSPPTSPRPPSPSHRPPGRTRADSFADTYSGPPSVISRPDDNPSTTSPEGKPTISRHPPPTALKDPKWRYCRRCRIVKPLRAHHCRHCGTCVLGMDHHCPWVGGCVGARNHKYFLIFVSWAFVYCLFLLIVLGIALARPTASGDSNSLDGQQVGLAAVAGFFALFTSGMSSTHTYLLMYNMTTIEHMGLSRMKEREQASLDRAFGTFELLDKRRTVLRWNREWGAPMTEGNPFWLGTATNWRSVMGESRLGWFLPLSPGKSAQDGTDYPLNPRYTSDGRWQKREFWPEEYR